MTQENNVVATEIVCPHCRAINRVPTNRLANAPICGKCKTFLFDGKPIELNSQTFAQFIERNDIPVLVDFWAPWCGPCKMMAPACEQAAKKLEPGVRLAKVNIDEAQDLASKYGIQSIPTLMVFRQGKDLARKNGAMDMGSIVNWVKSLS